MFTAGFGQAIIDNRVEVAGGELIQILLGDLAVAVVAHDLEFVHAVLFLFEETEELMHEYPPQRLPDILVHGGRNRAYHPAVPVAMANLFAHFLRLGTVPEVLPRLRVEVAHDLLVLGAVAGHHIAVRVNEEGIETHIAGQETLLAVYIVDQTMVEVGAEPLLRTVGIEKFVDEIFKILRDHRAVVDDILRLHKVEAVVQRRRCKFHVHLIGKKIQRHEVGRVLVLNGHAEADVLHAHFNKFLKRCIAAVETVLQTADLIIGLLQALDGNSYADIGELLAEVDDAVCKETVGGDDDAVALFIEFAHNILQILTDEGLAARDVGEIHFGELFNRFD